MPNKTPQARLHRHRNWRENNKRLLKEAGVEGPGRPTKGKRTEIDRRARIKHRAKYNERNREWQRRNPGKVFNWGLIRRYGITADQYYAMCLAQGGKCAICMSEPATGKRLHVDHCHKTGTFRGLLCHRCNTSVGLLKEDVIVVESMINYLNKHLLHST